MSIKFYVNEQSIELKTEIDIASDTIKFVSLNFTFCDSWKGYTKTVQFTQRTNTFSVNLGVNGTNCYLPNEITDGLCAISVFGTKDNTKRATTVPLNIRVKRSGFIEDSIIPSDTQPSVIEQIIEDINDLKEKIANIPIPSPNRLAEGFDLQFGEGYQKNGIEIYYDKNTNSLTLNGTAYDDINAGEITPSKQVFLDMGYYEFINCEDGNILESGHGNSPLPFKLTFNAHSIASIFEELKTGFFLENYAIMTDRTTAAAQPDKYNKLKRDCYGTMGILIPAGSSFNNETFHPYLSRYSAYVE